MGRPTASVKDKHGPGNFRIVLELRPMLAHVPPLPVLFLSGWTFVRMAMCVRPWANFARIRKLGRCLSIFADGKPAKPILKWHGVFWVPSRCPLRGAFEYPQPPKTRRGKMQQRLIAVAAPSVFSTLDGAGSEEHIFAHARGQMASPHRCRGSGLAGLVGLVSGGDVSVPGGHRHERQGARIERRSCSPTAAAASQRPPGIGAGGDGLDDRGPRCAARRYVAPLPRHVWAPLDFARPPTRESYWFQGFSGRRVAKRL